MYYAYQYVLGNDGVDTSSGYPYKGRVNQIAENCSFL